MIMMMTMMMAMMMMTMMTVMMVIMNDEADLVFCLSMAAISPSQSDQKLNGERDEKIKVSDHCKDDGDGGDFYIHKRRLRF